MNAREFDVLQAVGIVTTLSQQKGRGWEATAAQVADVLNTGERIDAPGALTPIEVGGILHWLAKGYPARRAPLVERIDMGRWRLSDAGLGVLCA